MHIAEQLEIYYFLYYVIVVLILLQQLHLPLTSAWFSSVRIGSVRQDGFVVGVLSYINVWFFLALMLKFERKALS